MFVSGHAPMRQFTQCGLDFQTFYVKVDAQIGVSALPERYRVGFFWETTLRICGAPSVIGTTVGLCLHRFMRQSGGLRTSFPRAPCTRQSPVPFPRLMRSTLVSLGDDFRSLLAYSVFLAWFSSAYMFIRQCRWSMDGISTSPVYLAGYCSVLRRLRTTRNILVAGK